MANGRVITGYSKPYVALYNVSDNAVTYSDGMPLARGVSVSIEPESGDGNDFYADNVTAESVGGTFTGGTMTLTVDGLKDAARKLVMGDVLRKARLLSALAQRVPLRSMTMMTSRLHRTLALASSFAIWRTALPHTYRMSSLRPYSARRITEAATAGEEDIEFQTTELEATIMRDDTQYHRWQRVAEAQTTEALAEAVIKAILGIA